jgi:hypothetical protein
MGAELGLGPLPGEEFDARGIAKHFGREKIRGLGSMGEEERGKAPSDPFANAFESKRLLGVPARPLVTLAVDRHHKKDLGHSKDR